MNKHQEQALDFFNNALPRRLEGRTKAVNAIMKHPRPNAEAKRWVKFFKGQSLPDNVRRAPRGKLADLSDVQELMVSLRNEHGHIDVHVKKPVQQLAEAVAQGMVNMSRFRRAAKVIAYHAKQGTSLPWENHPVAS